MSPFLAAVYDQLRKARRVRADAEARQRAEFRELMTAGDAWERPVPYRPGPALPPEPVEWRFTYEAWDEFVRNLRQEDVLGGPVDMNPAKPDAPRLFGLPVVFTGRSSDTFGGWSLHGR